MSKKNTKFDGDEKPFITSVTLGGFQVFDKPTTIPLGKLTFLFGPNSAGKSSIEDGLAFLLHVVKNGALSGLDAVGLAEHWRRDENGYSPFLTMGLTASIPTNLRICLDVPNGDEGSDYPSFGHEISVVLRYQYDEDYEELGRSPYFEMGVNGIPILELDEGSSFGVNFGHPMLSGFVLGVDYDFLARNLPKHVSHSNGWVKLLSNYVWLHQEEIDRQTVLYGMENADRYSDDPSQDFEKFREPLRAAVDEVANFFDQLKQIALGNMTVAPNIVPASRTVPSRKELTFLFPERCVGVR